MKKIRFIISTILLSSYLLSNNSITLNIPEKIKVIKSYDLDKETEKKIIEYFKKLDQEQTINIPIGQEAYLKQLLNDISNINYNGNKIKKRDLAKIKEYTLNIASDDIFKTNDISFLNYCPNLEVLNINIDDKDYNRSKNDQIFKNLKGFPKLKKITINNHSAFISDENYSFLFSKKIA